MLKRRSILKSIIDINNDKTEKTYINDNYSFIANSNVEFKSQEHIKIFNSIKNHADKFMDVPSLGRLKVIYAEDPDTLEEINNILKEPAVFATNFIDVVDVCFEDQQKKALVNLLKETNNISEGGKKVGRDFLKGSRAAVNFFVDSCEPFLKTERYVKDEGSLDNDAMEAYDHYIENKDKPVQGLLTGLETLDMATYGIKNAELWLLVAYVGELKTTQAMNYAYTQAIEQGKSVLFISLEMEYQKIRDLFICMHSANLNLWISSEWSDAFPLSYDTLMKKELTAREEEFFKFLCEDFENNKDYGKINIYKPSEGFTVSQLKAWSHQQYRKKPFDIIYLDYIELLNRTSTGEYTIELNQRIKDLKQFALNFNNGQGIPLVSAYQANRKGKEHADKNEGEYRLDALSYANEAERSADMIIYSYLNEELRERNKVKIGCLKYRSGEMFKQFQVSTVLCARKMYELPNNNEDVSQLVTKNKRKKISQDELVESIL